MKFLYKCLYGLLLCVNVCVQAQNLTSGLLAWYKFDGDTKDAGPYAHHGSPVNITFGPGKCGQPNSAAYLNGKDAYVNLPLASLLNGKKQLTVTAWVKPAGFNNIQQTLKSVYSHWLDYGTSGPVGLLFGVGPDSSVVGAFSAGYQVGSVHNVVHSSEWQLIILLYDGTKVQAADRALFQVNCTEYLPNCGDIYSSCSGTPNAIGSTAKYTYIGARRDNSSVMIDYFEGYIDDVRLYDRILSKEELNKLFLECGPPLCDDNNCLTDDQLNPVTCQCDHITKPKPSCDDNNCLTDDQYNSVTCQCEHIDKQKPNCDDNNSQTDDTYDPATCMCQHTPKSNPVKPGVYLPSAFTPDKDGVNDSYKPIYQGVTRALLTIFDRWGEVIFQGNNLTDTWDGTYRGVPCSQGIYPFILSGLYDTGQEFTMQGNISLIK